MIRLHANMQRFPYRIKTTATDYKSSTNNNIAKWEFSFRRTGRQREEPNFDPLTVPFVKCGIPIDRIQSQIEEEETEALYMIARGEAFHVTR